MTHALPTALPTDDKIRETAYQFWLDEGQPEGRDAAHWQMAIDALTPAQPKVNATRKFSVKDVMKAAAKAVADTVSKPKAAAKPRKAKAV